jgi:hypothetical protein
MIKYEIADIIVAILIFLEESMDEEIIDHKKINHEVVGISYPKYCRVLSMMVNDDLIDGLNPIEIAGSPYTQYKFMDPCITLRGLEYLAQNRPTARAYALLKEIKSWIPGM